MGRYMKKEGCIKAEGYMTVEAAMVLPIVLSTILLVIYLMFFRYNRCLFEQDLGILFVHAMSENLVEMDIAELSVREKAMEIDWDKYLNFEKEQLNYAVENNCIVIEGTGLQTLFSMGQLFHDTNWKVWREYKGSSLEPIFVLRQINKLEN